MVHTSARTSFVVLMIVALMLPTAAISAGGPGKGGGETETPGNNLSFPVLWSDGVAKVLPGSSGVEKFEGAYWYYWLGADGSELTCDPTGRTPGYICPDPLPEAYETVYLQQDANNSWQAASAIPAAETAITGVDWGDNLEARNWPAGSKIRTEVVLFKTLETPMTGYTMRHLYGQGTSEMWGTNTVTYDSLEATLYSHCVRYVIQAVNRSTAADLVWTSDNQWAGPGAGSVIFSGRTWNEGSSAATYSAELNIPGKIIYGYNWNTRRLPAGDYRLTFHLDGDSCAPFGVTLNTTFEGATIRLPVEVEAALAAASREAEPSGGGVAAVDAVSELTYIDITLTSKSGSGPRTSSVAEEELCEPACVDYLEMYSAGLSFVGDHECFLPSIATSGE